MSTLPTFFTEILGAHGLGVMEKLSKASQELGAYIMPRVIISWLRQVGYGDVHLPTGCPLDALNKSGYGYSGRLEIENTPYEFENAPEEHVAAVIAVAIKSSVTTSLTKSVDLARLGKTIDLLVKSVKKVPNQFEHMINAGHIEPEQPAQPTLKQPAQNATKVNKKLKIPQVKKLKPLVVNKSEMQKTCQVCSSKMFKNESFTGCICFQPLAKSVTVTQTRLGVSLSFGEGWDEDAYLTLIKVLKND